MLKGWCLKCGRSGHSARSCLGRAISGGGSSATPATPKTNCKAPPPAPPAASTVSVSSSAPRVQPKSPAPAMAVNWEQRAEAWLVRKREIVFDDSGWTKFKPVLLALSLAWKSPKRYLDKDSDSPNSLWKLGRRQPRGGSDFKRGKKNHGGNEPFYVRRDFLKAVLVERYRDKLTRTFQYISWLLV